MFMVYFTVMTKGKTKKSEARGPIEPIDIICKKLPIILVNSDMTVYLGV